MYSDASIRFSSRVRALCSSARVLPLRRRLVFSASRDCLRVCAVIWHSAWAWLRVCVARSIVVLLRALIWWSWRLCRVLNCWRRRWKRLCSSIAGVLRDVSVTKVWKLVRLVIIVMFAEERLFRTRRRVSSLSSWDSRSWRRWVLAFWRR